MSSDVASRSQPPCSSSSDGGANKPQLDEHQQPPQRKCGVHLFQHPNNNQDDLTLETDKKGEADGKPNKKRSVDTVVEAYLDEHQVFLDDYVRRKVSRRQLEQWLFFPNYNNSSAVGAEAAATASVRTSVVNTGLAVGGHSSDSNLLKTGGLLSCVRGQQQGGGHQRQRSRSFTPLRKLSASTFEAGGLATPILATTSDGQPSFLRTTSISAWPPPTPPTPSTATSFVKPAAAVITSCASTESSSSIINDRKDLLLKLLPDILLATDVTTLAKTTMKSAKLLLGGAERADLLVLNAPNSFDGLTYTLIRDVMVRRCDVKQNYLLNSALTSSQVLNVNDASGIILDEGRFEVANALIGPLSKSDGAAGTIGCLQLYNKNGGFTPEDEAHFQNLLSVATIALLNVQAHQAMCLELARSEVFLELARTVFREPTRLEPTMLTILTNFLSLIDCERCQILLSDPEQPTVFKRVFDLERTDLGLDLEAPYEGRFPVNGDITGQVASTGEKVNLVRHQTYRSFLCSPIHDPDGRVLGVISLINKEVERDEAVLRTSASDDDDHFTSNDERFVEAFAIFCGMAIRNAADYEKAVVSEAKLQVAFEVMNYQATSSTEEASTLFNLPVAAASTYNLDSFHFSYLNMDDNATLTATIRIFIDLGLIARFNIDYNTLCRWLLTVKRNYRNETVQYHNWYHAFNVTQMMFCMLFKTRWSKIFSTTDCLGLIVACISHDLDHRGTNNSFQLKMNNPLAKLYSTSTLERHHLNQCLLILTLRGNGILDNLNKEEYTETLAVIERSILATDLALHFRDAPAMTTLASNVQQSQGRLRDLLDGHPENKALVQGALMTAADLGAVTKPWDVHRAVSQLIAEEFWTQGDIERREFHVDPQPMFDRTMALGTVQIGFIDGLCLPLYEDMAKFSKELQPLVAGCLANRVKWAAADEAENKRSETNAERARNL